MAQKLLRILRALLAALGLLLLVITFTPAVRWYAAWLAGVWDDPEGEVLIVLGAGTIDDSLLAANSYWRSVYGLHAWHGGKFQQVIVSGRRVAPLMRDFLVCHGVPASAIRVEDTSTSTRENALDVAKMLEGVPGQRVLVTSDYHMFRARRQFEKAGLRVRAVPFPDVIKRSYQITGRWDGFVTLVEETAKIAYYEARGWM